MPHKIFVGSLPMNATNDAIRELFEQYGTVVECDVLGAFGFVHMSTEDEAKAAIADLNGYSMNGTKISVEMSTQATQGRSKAASRAGATTKIFIGNISKSTSKTKLQDLFETYGTVVESDILNGYGFVHMEKDHEAFKAIKGLNGYVMDGNRLNVELSNTGSGRSSSGRERDLVGRGGRGDSVGGVRGGRSSGGMRYDPYSMSGSSGKRSSEYDSYPYPPDAYSRMQSSRSESLARDLLELYTSNPAAFDAYARDPLVRKSLHLPPVPASPEPFYSSHSYLEDRLQQARSGANPYASPSDYAMSSGVGGSSSAGWGAADLRSAGAVPSSVAKGRSGGAGGSQGHLYTSFE